MGLVLAGAAAQRSDLRCESGSEHRSRMKQETYELGHRAHVYRMDVRLVKQPLAAF